MWTIYSIGDPVFLQQVLNAVAMLFASTSFLQFVSIGFLIGLLIVAFQGLLQGAQSIRFQGLLVSFVLYSLLFVPTVSVTIEGAYSGSARVVDHVPLGPAVVGATVSNLGYGLTRLFEQSLRHPDPDRAWLCRCPAGAGDGAQNRALAPDDRRGQQSDPRRRCRAVLAQLCG